MNIFLTGDTGFIGSRVLEQLIHNGHQVTALVRSQDSANKVEAAGATALQGDITDEAWLAEQLVNFDGAIHTASPGDQTSQQVDTAVAQAVARAFANTDKPYVHTSGVWIYGSSDTITEESPIQAPTITAWRSEVEAMVTGAQGIRASIVVPGIVYGYENGLPTFISGAPRTEDGALILIGDGSQHWPTVHADDIADLYVRALTDGAAGNYYIGATENVTVKALAEAASKAAGITAEPVAESIQASRERIGALLADALLLDQQVVTTKAHDELGWTPQQPSLLSELEAGKYPVKS